MIEGSSSPSGRLQNTKIGKSRCVVYRSRSGMFVTLKEGGGDYIISQVSIGVTRTKHTNFYFKFALQNINAVFLFQVVSLRSE